MHFPMHVRNGPGRTHRNRAIVHKQLAGFSNFNAGLIISEKDQNYLVKIFLMTQKSSKRLNVDAVFCRVCITGE